MNNQADRSEASLIRVIRMVASLSLGAMAAFLASIRDVSPQLRLEFSAWTMAAFAAALTISGLFWRLVFQPDPTQDPAARVPGRQRRRAVRFGVVCLILGVATLATFGLSLKGVGNQRIREILQGAAIAVLTLSVLGWMLWQIARFLERDSGRNLENRGDPEDARNLQHHPEKKPGASSRIQDGGPPEEESTDRTSSPDLIPRNLSKPGKGDVRTGGAA